MSEDVRGCNKFSIIAVAPTDPLENFCPCGLPGRRKACGAYQHCGLDIEETAGKHASQALIMPSHAAWCQAGIMVPTCVKLMGACM